MINPPVSSWGGLKYDGGFLQRNRGILSSQLRSNMTDLRAVRSLVLPTHAPNCCHYIQQKQDNQLMFDAS